MKEVDVLDIPMVKMLEKKLISLFGYELILRKKLTNYTQIFEWNVNLTKRKRKK